MPPEAALGMFMNMGLANAWKATPIIQGVGLSMDGKEGMPEFIESLKGKQISKRDQIRNQLNALRNQ